MVQWISTVATDTTGWGHLERLTAVDDRMGGTEGERRAAAATRDALSQAGARSARLEPFDLQGWIRGTSELGPGHDGNDPPGGTVDCIALPRSPSAAATGEFVDIGHGVEESYDERAADGAVVMAASNVPSRYDRPVHRREKYRLAVEAGAAAFVFRNHAEGCLAPTGSVGTEADPIGPIPAVGVSREAGERLARRHAGDPVEVTVEADIHDATSRNVHAEIGPDTDDRVLFTSHVDAHDVGEGAVDNGGGTAMLVTLAAALAERAGDLDTRVEFVGFGAEEVGLVGAKHHADTVDPGRVKAIVNLDGVVRGRTLQAWTHEFDELVAALEAAADRFDHPVEVLPSAGPPGDQWPLVRHGVPGYFVASVRDVEGRGWGHTAADTLGKLDVRNLREQALVLTELAVGLADDDLAVDHATPEEVAAAFERAGRDAELRTGGDWPDEWVRE